MISDLSPHLSWDHINLTEFDRTSTVIRGAYPVNVDPLGAPNGGLGHSSCFLPLSIDQRASRSAQLAWGFVTVLYESSQAPVCECTSCPRVTTVVLFNEKGLDEIDSLDIGM